jgi:integrase
MALTELGIRKLRKPKPGKRREKYDREIRGFGIRITDRGIRSYILVYSYGGRRRRATLGRIGEISLEDAREEARRLRGLIRQGRDPAAEEKAARATAKTTATPTFGEAMELYEKRVLVGKRTGRQIRMTIDLHLMPSWKDLLLSSITRTQVLERVEGLVDRDKPEMARSVFQICRRFFGWAISRGTFGIEHSPTDKLRPADICGERPVRERILSHAEWRALFRAIRALGHPYESIIELLALTGLRLREVAEARFGEFDLADLKRWTIPSERMKSDRPHVVPLTPRMIAVVSSLSSKSEFLFPNDRGNRPFTSFSVFKKKIDQRMAEELERESPPVKFEAWRIHDVRRSLRTALSELPVPGGDLVRELLLAHAKPGLHRVYDQYAYLDERRRAYELWEQKLTAILERRSADVLELVQRSEGKRG